MRLNTKRTRGLPVWLQRHGAEKRPKRFLPAILVLFSCALFLSGCSSLASKNSPDLVYASNAAEARLLQVPPDLTDVSNAEQFVIPGTNGSAVTADTLLPLFDSVRFMREGGQSWLQYEQAPERLWPRLLAFLRQENYRVSRTEPAAGLIVTQWRAAIQPGEQRRFRLNADQEAFSRVAFRLERDGSGARLFARSEAVSEQALNAMDDPDAASWPANSHDPEYASTLLSQLLVFLGVDEQRARGMLSAEQASAVFDDAFIERSSAGRDLRILQGYQPAFNRVLQALQVLDYTVISSNDTIGRIDVSQGNSTIAVVLTPLHVSAVRLQLTDATTGQRLSARQEQDVLLALRDQMA